MSRLAACCCALLLLASPARADLDSGLKALELSNYRLALQELRPLAERGNARAQSALGKMYLFGWGVPKDEKEAVKWLRKAAEQGDAWARAKLVYAYEHGVGVERNPAEAEKWRHWKAGKPAAAARPEAGATPGPALTARSPREGYELDPATADALEARLRARPGDLAARTLLLGYYFANAGDTVATAEAIEARRRHILWLIRSHPELPLAGAAEAGIDPKGHALADPDGYEEAKAHWLAQARRPRGKPAPVIANAARFLQLHDKALAEALLLRGQALAPRDRSWAARLGYLYALGIMGIDGLNHTGLPMSVDPAGGAYAQHARQALDASDDAQLLGTAGKLLGDYGSMLKAFGLAETDQDALAERYLTKARALEPQNPGWAFELGQFYRLRYIKAGPPEQRRAAALKALGYLEQALGSSTDDGWRSTQLQDLAKLAFEAGELEQARGHAQALLAIAERHGKAVQFGPNIHDGHMVLGRIALKQGDREGAKAHLLAAGATPGGGTLASFGPNMSLAKDLLAAGERDAVLDYLELCKRFWTYPGRPLDGWIAAIRAGRTPEFGANLNY